MIKISSARFTYHKYLKNGDKKYSKTDLFSYDLRSNKTI